MNVLAIDPGPTQSAYVFYDGKRPYRFGKVDNDVLVSPGNLALWTPFDRCHLAIEMIASYGMPVGREVFETCVWIGRFLQAWSGFSVPSTFVYRQSVKLHLCGQPRAMDSNVRQALIDRFGPGKDKAIGTKKQPGPLYGVSADVWQALAVAVTFADVREDC